MPGPFPSESASPDSFREQLKWKTAVVPRPPLDYYMCTLSGSQVPPWPSPKEGYLYHRLSWITPTSAPVSAGAYARAYNAYASRVKGASAEMAVTLAEADRSLNMIGSRAKQVFDIYRGVRSGNLPAIKKALRLPNFKPSSYLKDTSNLWLEVKFGWLPLVSDVSSAVDVLQRDFSITKVCVGRGQNVYNENYDITDPSPYVKHSVLDCSVVHKCRVQSTIRCENPNIALANSFGFVNPASVVWELVPFSFIVDWFLPVGKFISNFSNMAGLSSSRDFRTFYRIGNCYEYEMDEHENEFYSSTSGASVFRIPSDHPLPSFLSQVYFPTPSLSKAVTALALWSQRRL